MLEKPSGEVGALGKPLADKIVGMQHSQCFITDPAVKTPHL
jgi:hypothetical protein